MHVKITHYFLECVGVHNGPSKISPSWIAVKGQEVQGCSHMGEVVAGVQACTPLVQSCSHTVASFL